MNVWESGRMQTLPRQQPGRKERLDGVGDVLGEPFKSMKAWKIAEAGAALNPSGWA